MDGKVKKKKKRRRKLNKRIKLGILFAVFVFILVFLLMFKVENVIVTGNERYTDDEIKSLIIDEESFNNTLLFCLFNGEVETPDVMLLESIEVTYVDRNTIRLKANEKLTIGMFRVGDKVCCIDQDGIVIEIIDYENAESLDLPLIYNLATSGTVGERIDTTDSILNTLHALMSSFERYEIMPDSIYIEEEQGDEDGEESVVNTYSLVFGEITVDLGADELLEEKMERVEAILRELSELGVESGTLHLANYDEDTENIIFDTNE